MPARLRGIVTSSRRVISLRTESFVMIDRPKSPCATPLIHVQYWTETGSSSLYFALIAAITSGEVG